MLNQREDELSLVKKSIKGDRESIGLLYDRYIDKIYRFIYFKVGHKETAEDICSEVFLKALSSLTNFNLADGYFSAWLYKIALNSIIDYQRKKREVALDDNYAEKIVSRENIFGELASRQELEKVSRYLKQMKPEQADIILMRVWGGLSYREIAQAMGKSEENCKVIFSRSIRQFRDKAILTFILISYLNNF